MATFTAVERRILGLSQAENTDSPECEALRKIIDTFPWMLDVADCKFDQKVACGAIALHHQSILYADIVQKYHNKKEDVK